MASFAVSQNARASALRQKIDPDSVVSAIAINMLTLCMPLAMMQVFERVLPNQSYGTLLGIFLALLAALATDFALKISRASFVLHAANQHGRAVGRDLSNALFDGDAKALNALSGEAVIEKVMSLLGLRRTENEQLVKLVVDHIFSCLFLLIIWALAGWIVAIPLSIMALLFVVAMWAEPQFRQASQHRRDYKIRSMSFLSEVLSQVQLIKLLGLEQPMLRRYEMLHGNATIAGNKIVQLQALCYGAASMGAQIVTALTCAFGGVLAIEGTLTIAELAACMLLTNRAVQPVVQFAFLTSVKDDANQRTDGLADVIHTYKSDIQEDQTKITGGLIAQDLGLKLPNAQGYRFCDASFAVRPGDMVVIDGPMITQPTSILKMIAGEMKPDAGSVVLEGIDHPTDQNLPPKGLVFEPREPVILDGNILQNLTAFDANMDTDTALNLAERMGLGDHIARLPDGPRTQLLTTHRDVGSPGFYKRISLCRALNAAPRVLLLEDPFAFLDPAGKAKLETLLLGLQGKVTVLLTRPSPRLLDAANHVVTLKPTTRETTLKASIQHVLDNAIFKSARA